MGQDYGCICLENTGNVPGQKSDCQLEKPGVIENEQMKFEMFKAEVLKFDTEEGNKRVARVQSVYRSHKVRQSFQEDKKKMEYIFDQNVLSNYATSITSQPNDQELDLFLYQDTKQAEKYCSIPKPSEEEIKKQYPLIFQRDALKFKNETVYKGTWNYKGKKHGYGTFIDESGNKYSGYWNNDLIDGIGSYITNDGNFYEGEWKDGKINGKGKLILRNGYSYEGMWNNERQHGEGSEINPDKSTYVGNFYNGIKHGKGKFTFPDGSYYEGDFNQGVVEGKGKFVWKDGRIYEGDWVNNQMEGEGIFIWPEGYKYVGNYKHSIKDGYGIYYWSDRYYYKGTWLNNTQHGEGALYDGDKIVRQGIFRYGKLIKFTGNSQGLSKESIENKYENNIVKKEIKGRDVFDDISNQS